MKKIWKRTLAMLLVVIMVGGAAPIGALAEMEWPTLPEGTVTSWWNIGVNAVKSAASLLGGKIQGLSLTASAENYSGKCGSNLNWSLDTETGELSITGSGKMWYYDFDDTPWYSNRLSVKSITIGSGVTSIGVYAFRNCTSLTNVTLSESVLSIGRQAFYDCTSLSSVTIPDGVTSIDNHSFYNCTSLTSVTIPDSVTSIGEHAFVNTGYYNTESNWTNGVLYIGSHLIKANNKIPSTYLIASGTRTVADNAFTGCKSLTNVTIPGSVSNIGAEAFYNCTSLSSVTIQDGVTSIGEYAFIYCKSLLNITIPGSVTSIGKSAFSGCTSLISMTLPFVGLSMNAKDENSVFGAIFGYTSSRPESGTAVEQYYQYSGNANYHYSCYYYIPSSLREVTLTNSISLPYGAFYNCSMLTKITLPDSVGIADCAFLYCTGLTSIKIPNCMTDIGDKAFLGCANLDSVELGGSVFGISQAAFSGCTNLTRCTIPDSVTYISNSAFANCTNLASITFPERLRTIGDGAFHNCTSLTNVIIPNSVKNIGMHAFRNCLSLTNVTIPDGVTEISGGAFESCTSLASIIIPDGVMTILRDAFDNTAYYNTESNWTGDVLYIGNHCIQAKNTISGACAIRAGTRTVAYSAFEDCTNLVSISIPDSVTNIEGDAFLNTAYYNTESNWTGDVLYIGKHLIEAKNTLSGKYSILPGTRTIARSAFSCAKRLTSLTIPDSVTNFGQYAFYYNTSLAHIYYAGTLEQWCSISFGNYYSNPCSYAHNLYINGQLLTEAVIPDRVTDIGNYAFARCEGLTSVTIPGGVTNIGDGAFYGCKSLTHVMIPNSVTSIGERAFYGCGSLESVTIPESVTSIGSSAFSGCTSLANVMIPDSVTSIGNGAFQGCTSLNCVAIPSSVTIIGEYAFYDCTNFANITIPDSVTSIGRYAFGYVCNIMYSGIAAGSPWGASNANKYVEGFFVFDSAEKTALLRCSSGIQGEVSIPNSVTSIGDRAFYNCRNLAGVTIPDGVANIGNKAFYACTNLASATIPDSVTSIGESAFDSSCKNLADVYYMGSETQWRSIHISQYNYALSKVAMHYDYSPFPFTKKHVVANSQTNNLLYSAMYLDNLGVPMDGSNDNPDLCIPGLSENSIPQGVAYWCDRNWFLISAYDADAKEPNAIFALDASTGKFVGQYSIQDIDPANHIGGIAVTDHNFYLTLSNSKIGYIPLSDFKQSGKAETVEVKTVTSLSGVLNGANTSYLNFSEGCIWVGNYYRHDVSAYKTPASDTANSRVLGYVVSGDSSEAEWNALRGFADPDHRINIPNSIEGIQGVALGDGKIYLHSSFNRTKKSVLTVMDFTPGVQDSLRNMRQFDSMPMGEGICMKDGELYLLYESAAAKYRNGDGKGQSKHPTDVLWKFPYGHTPFDPENDSLSFGNWGYDPSTGFSCTHYSLLDEHKDILYHYRSIVDLEMLLIQSLSSWEGSCFGMSAMVALIKAGALQPSFFQTGAKNASDLAAPGRSKVIESLANYYQDVLYLYPLTLDGIFPGSEEECLKTLVSQMFASEYPVIIGFDIKNAGSNTKYGGHAVVGYRIQEENGWYRIDICDPNKKCRYLFIKTDYSDSYFTLEDKVRYNYSYDNKQHYKRITKSYTVEEASETYDYINLQKALQITRSGSKLNALEKHWLENDFLILNYQDFRIASSNGTYAVVSNGEVVEGNLNITYAGTFNEAGRDLKIGFCCPLSAEGESFTITPAADAVSVVDGQPLQSFLTSVAIDTEDGLGSIIETNRCSSITISGKDTVSVDAAEPCEQSITLLRTNTDEEWNALTVSGTVDELIIQKTDSGAMVQSDQSCALDAAVLDVFNKTELGTVSVPSGQTVRIEQGEQPGEIIVTESGVQRTVSMGHSVVFHTSGGTEIPALTDLPAGSVIAQPDAPTLLGYVFDGWYTSTEYLPENRWDFASDTVNENISLYAKWISLKDETYTEEFYLHKTDTEPAAVMKLAYQSPIAVPEGFDRVGYTMELVDCDTDRPVDLVTAVMGQNGIRVYAKYTPVKYYASFLVDGVQLGEKVPFTVETEKLAVPSDPIKAGYTFIGWSPEIPATMPAEDLEFTAVFEQDKYIATLIADGEIVKTIEYTHGQKSIQLPEVPEKEGFTGAWPSYSLTDGGVTITAVYTKNQYTITWIVDGETTSRKVYYGDSVQKPADPIKENYSFVGWSPDVPLTMPAKDMTFDAVFEKNPKPIGYLTDVSLQDLTLFYKDSGKLIPKVVMQGEAKYTVTYKVENERILSVSEDGTVKTLHWGKTNVTATVSDESGNSFSVTCAVQVKCYLWQWLIIIFLFGWIWY